MRAAAAVVTTVLLVIAVAAACAPGASAQAADTEDPAFLVISGGYYDVLHNVEPAGSFGLEYRHDDKLLGIFKPMVATYGTSHGAFWFGAGIAVDVYFGNRFVVTGSFAPGAYHQGNGKDLGHTLEFRSQIEVGYRFDDRSRLTLGFNHLSNGSQWSDINPGVEILTVNYYLPLDGLLD